MNSDDIATLAIVGIGVYVAARYLLPNTIKAAGEAVNPTLTPESGPNVIEQAGPNVQVKQSDGKTLVQIGGTVYGFREQDWSKLNFAQRALLRADASVVPGTWLTRAVLG